MEIIEDDYLNDRVKDQIDWFNKKSGTCKHWFYRLKVSETILALLIPFLTGYITNELTGLKILVGVIGILVAALAGLLTLFKYQENWVQYRTTAETLTQERFLFIARTGPYKGDDRFKLFVERVESMLTKENSHWASFFTSTAEKAEERKLN